MESTGRTSKNEPCSELLSEEDKVEGARPSSTSRLMPCIMPVLMYVGVQSSFKM